MAAPPQVDEVDASPEEQLVRHRVELDPAKVHHVQHTRAQDQAAPKAARDRRCGGPGSAAFFPENVNDAISSECAGRCFAGCMRTAQSVR
jgi:hypothetical protein